MRHEKVGRQYSKVKTSFCLVGQLTKPAVSGVKTISSTMMTMNKAGGMQVQGGVHVQGGVQVQGGVHMQGGVQVQGLGGKQTIVINKGGSAIR